MDLLRGSSLSCNLGRRFLAHFILLVDIKNRLLEDPLTSFSATVTGDSTRISTVSQGKQPICFTVEILPDTHTALLCNQTCEAPSDAPHRDYWTADSRQGPSSGSRTLPSIQGRVRVSHASRYYPSRLQQQVFALHIVSEKNSDIRPCENYLGLNSRTVINRYLVPNFQEISTLWFYIFSRTELVKAFHKIPFNPAHILKTAIITLFDLFEYVWMPFGSRNARQTFQRFMDEVLRRLPFCFTYIDELLIASSDAETHQQHLQQVFTRLQDYGIQINLRQVCVWCPLCRLPWPHSLLSRHHSTPV